MAYPQHATATNNSTNNAPIAYSGVRSSSIRHPSEESSSSSSEIASSGPATASSTLPLSSAKTPEIASAAAVSTTTSTTARYEPLPIYRQYVYDRVEGNSYIPRDYRKGGEKYGEPYLNSDGEDLTSWRHRPPHFLCYVPAFVRRNPDLMEQNAFCELIGKIGLHRFKYHSVWRRRIFLVGLGTNFCSMVLIAWAAQAYTTNHGLLPRASFSRGDAFVPGHEEFPLARIDIGFRRVVVQDHNGWLVDSQVSSFGEFCAQGTSATDVVINSALCGECQATMYLIQILFNLFIVIRNQMYDVTRIYASYDSNCPNFHGKVLSVLSVFLGLMTINTYQNRCFQALEKEVQDAYSQNLTATAIYLFGNNDTSVTEASVDFHWGPGPGMICLIVATLLRFVDLVANFLVPSPSITRHKDEQMEYDMEFGPREEIELGGAAQRLQNDDGEDDGSSRQEEQQQPPQLQEQEEEACDDNDLSRKGTNTTNTTVTEDDWNQQPNGSALLFVSNDHRPDDER